MITAQGKSSWEIVDAGDRAIDIVVRQLRNHSAQTIIVTDPSRNQDSVEGAKIVSANRTQGAVCTAIAAFDFIDESLPVLISSGDAFFESEDVSALISSSFDQGHEVFSLTTKSVDPRMSFIELGKNSELLAFHEKVVVSETATTGMFGFQRPSMFLESAAWVLENDMSLDGNFYMSSAVNYFIMKGEKVANIDTSEIGLVYRKVWNKNEDL